MDQVDCSNLYIYLSDDDVVKFSFDGKIFDIFKIDKIEDKSYIYFKMNQKLLKRILMGPKYGHWNLAEGGSHIRFYREPDIYERGIHYCMNYFHA